MKYQVVYYKVLQHIQSYAIRIIIEENRMQLFLCRNVLSRTDRQKWAQNVNNLINKTIRYKFSFATHKGYQESIRKRTGLCGCSVRMFFKKIKICM